MGACLYFAIWVGIAPVWLQPDRGTFFIIARKEALRKPPGGLEFRKDPNGLRLK